MSDTKTRSTDFLLILAGVVIAGVVGAWFLLDGGEDAAPALETAPLPAPVVVEEPAAQAEGRTAEVSAQVGEDVAVNLSKARMAAGAGLLTEPAGQNALYFYTLVLDAEPEHEEAQAELAELAAEISSRIAAALDAGDFATAAPLAARLAAARPSTPIVAEFEDRLIAEQQRLLLEALNAAQAGNQSVANALLRRAERLPRADTELLGQAREQIAAIRAERARAAAAARRAAVAGAGQGAQPEAGEERVAGDPDADAGAGADQPASAPEPESLARAREALAAGRLLEPAEDSVTFHLARARSENADPAAVAEVEGALAVSLVERVRDTIEAGELESAETMIADLEDVPAVSEQLDLLDDELDQAYVDREAERVISSGNLQVRELVQPVYPRAAIRRSVEGYVDVEFTVDRDGRTTDIEIVEADPRNIFDRATTQAVAQWRFEPREFRGQVIPARVRTRVAYNLD